MGSGVVLGFVLAVPQVKPDEGSFTLDREWGGERKRGRVGEWGDRVGERQSGREREREREREEEWERERQTDRQRDAHRDTESGSQREN